MPPKITRVRWSASDVPWGMNFDENNGTFSGTPDEPGEYVVPVQVQTNYGTSPVENVTIVIEDPPRPAYAIGTYAATWSDGAAADADGFRRLNIPNVNRLTALYGGFCAHTAQGDWYIVGGTTLLFPTENDSGALKGLQEVYTDYKPTKPIKFPVNGVLDIAQGRGLQGQTAAYTYAFYRTSSKLYYGQAYFNGSTTTYTYGKYSAENFRKVQQDFCSGMTILTDKVSMEGVLSITIPDDSVIKKNSIKKIGVVRDFSPKVIYFLLMDGRLYQGIASVSTLVCEQVKPEYGSISNFWCFYATSGSKRFIQTLDHKLYAMGYNNDYSLGLPSAKTYSDFELVGYYSAKKITSAGNYTFMLTDDGKLYHTGKAISGITEQHNSFTQIFPNRVFQDIILAPERKTLVVTFKE